eukprot:15358755-Alexandrium_andersonii.AAC.1
MSASLVGSEMCIRDRARGLTVIADGEGSRHASHTKVDQLVREAWAGVTDGGPDVHVQAAEFCCKHSRHLVT